MKILLCVNHFWPSIGGAEYVALRLARYFQKNNEITVATRRMKGRNISQCPTALVEYSLNEWTKFDKYIRDNKFDVVIIYSDVFDFFRQIITSNISYKLVVCLCGANWIYKNKSFANVFYRHSSNIAGIVCHSRHDRDFKLCSNSMLSSKTFIIPNGVDTEEFDSNTLSKEQLCPELADKRWILNCSNFFPGKGQIYMIDILNYMPQTDDMAYIQVSSDIPFAIGEQLEIVWKRDVAKKLNKHVKTHLVKNASRAEVVGYFKQSNVFAFPSEKEVAPLVILEAMAAGLPWVATDVGNVRDLKGGKIVPTIRDSNFHCHIDDRVKRSFAQYIQELRDYPQIAEDGRAQIDNDLNWEKILPMYDSLLG